MRRFGMLGLLLALVVSVPALAAPANPELVARDYVLDGGQPHEEQLKIGALDLQVSIAGGVAWTTATVRFENPSSRPVEGDFTLDLPRGSVVTGYALDVNDQMVDGVLVGERKARLAYEAQVRRGVDPGLAKVTRAGAFKTRVFPIMPGKGRSIRLTFATPLTPDTPFVLPLESVKTVGTLTVQVSGQDLATAPKITAPGGLAVGWNEGAASGKDIALSGALTIGPVLRAAPLLTARHREGDAFFDIEDVANPSSQTDTASRRMRVYWDRSLSRRDDNLAAELRLLDLYLAQARPGAIDLVLFDAATPEVKTFTGPGAREAVLAALKDVAYGSGASIAGLFDIGPAPADVCLLFSDGVITVDAYKPVRAPCRLYSVSSSPDADSGLLRALAARSSGEHLDLVGRTPEAALARLDKDAPRLVDIRTLDGEDVDFRVLPTGPGRFRVVGRMPRTGALTVRLADAADPVRTYTVREAASPRHDGLGALWAFDSLGEMSATDQPDQDAILAFARRYSVASPIAAFIVLERVEDYIAAGIAPPAMLGKDILAQYERAMAGKAAAARDERADRLGDMIELWDAQKEWWATRFDPVARPKPGPGGVRLQPRPPAAASDAAAPPPPPPPPAPLSVPPVERRDSGTEVESVVVTGSRREGVVQDAPVAVAGFSAEALEPATASGRPMTVALEPWNPDRPYLVALKAAPAGAFRTVFRAQEDKFGALPAFYLDVAEYLFREGRAKEAQAMALSAMELPVADVTTLTIVAARLMRYGDEARGIWLYERILYLEPDRPQPRRDLALALVDRAEHPNARPAQVKADYQRALDLLAEVIMTPWNHDYDGIEVISLMEANRLIARLAAIGVDRQPLDKRLVALLDVDLRVTMEWNTDITDMDLWIDEPGGERAIYNNPKTAIGGRLSNDMTRGYGPEEYLLRRTPRGEFVIQANVFSSDRLNPNGPVTIRVHIYRAWARPDEQVETLDIELKPGESGAKRLGSVRVGARATPP